MKRFTIVCSFGSHEWPTHFFIGDPGSGKHPLQYQSRWLSRERNGLIPVEAWRSFEEMQALAKRRGQPLEKVCVDAALSQLLLSKRSKLDLRSLVFWRSKSSKRKSSGSPETFEQKSSETESQHQTVRSKDRDSGTLLRSTFQETTEFILKMSHELCSNPDDVSSNARLLFLGISLYFASVSPETAALSDVYGIVTSEDPSFTLAVLLDTNGAILPQISYSLISQWLGFERALQKQVLALLTAAFVELAMSEDRQSEVISANMRAGLTSCFFRLLPSNDPWFS